MESSTKILRRLLDERGVEHEGGERSLRWRDRYGVMMQAFPLANGELGMGVWSCTPAQAIAATLTATDARPTQEESSVTCHDKNGFDVTFGFECTVCGAMTDGYMLSPADTGHYKQFNFCPMCGRRIEQ